MCSLSFDLSICTKKSKKYLAGDVLSFSSPFPSPVFFFRNLIIFKKIKKEQLSMIQIRLVLRQLESVLVVLHVNESWPLRECKYKPAKLFIKRPFNCLQ